MNELTAITETARVDTEATGRLMWALLEAARSLEDRLEETLGAIGLSAPRLGILTELVNAREPLALSELASRLSCVRSNITQLVDRLEADGLVRRVADQADRRSIRAEITDGGRELQALGVCRLAEVQGEVAVRLAALDRQALQRALDALR